MATNLVWYFAYVGVNRKEPPLIAPLNTQRYYTPIVDNFRKDTYIGNERKDWTNEMIKYIIRNKQIVVNFVFSRYRNYYTQHHDILTLIKSHQKQSRKLAPSEVNERRLLDKKIMSLKYQRKSPLILSKMYAATYSHLQFDMGLNLS